MSEEDYNATQLSERLHNKESNSSPDIFHESLNDSSYNKQSYEELVKENEALNLSLLSLTSHLAQVQFRLDQILNSDADNKQNLLGDLKEFTSEGVPEFNLVITENVSTNVISKLRKQLDSLESYAFNSGQVDSLPTSVQIKRQNLIIDQLKSKLNLHLNDFDSGNLSEDDLKTTIELALDEIITPLKDNEKLVEQLKTQINDLERFIEFLNGSGKNVELLAHALKMLREREALLNENYQNELEDDVEILDVNELEEDDLQWSQEFLKRAHMGSSRSTKQGHRNQKKIKNKETTIELVKKGIAILQLFAMSQFPLSSSSNSFGRGKTSASNHTSNQSQTIATAIKKTKNPAKVELAKSQHWGTLRARLEIAISQVIEKVNEYNQLLPEEHLMLTNSQKLSPISEDSTFLNQDDNLIIPIQSKNDETEDQEFSGKLHSIDGNKSPSQIQPSNDDASLVDVKISEGVFELEDVNGHQETEENPAIREKEKEIVVVIRKIFCPALRALMEHGLIRNSRLVMKVPSLLNKEPSESKMVISGTIFGCLPLISTSGKVTNSNMKTSRNHKDHLVRSLRKDSDDDFSPDEEEDSPDQDGRGEDQKQLHAWKLFLFYYELKNGSAYNDSPERKLSQSFDLNVVSGKVITNKKLFLSSLGNVIQNHGIFKRSDDAKFKAIISIALNEKKLTSWLKLILKNRIIIDSCYHPWSYTASTRFCDALESLSSLNSINFNLPIDLNIRHLKNINDAF